LHLYSINKIGPGTLLIFISLGHNQDFSKIQFLFNKFLEMGYEINFLPNISQEIPIFFDT
jgi:hypothetical protein